MCKDQESIQSSTTPDPGYQWESDKLTVDTTNESQEVSKQSYEPLLEGASAYAEHVANYFAVFSERGGQMFCLYSFYISLNGNKYCHLFVE